MEPITYEDSKHDIQTYDLTHSVRPVIEEWTTTW